MADSAQQKPAAVPDTTIALNPLTGFHLDDIREILRDTARKGARRPWLLARQGGRQLGKMARILKGSANYSPQAGDFRFRDPAWQENGYYRRLLQSHLSLQESMQEWLDDLQLDDVEQLRSEFLLRIISDSIAPSNHLLTNPQALRLAIASRGRSLLKGAANLLHDWRFNHGIPAQVSGDNFQLGKNIATSRGAVVYRNEVLELIQYQPTTAQVHRRPLLMVSAMINKFYALDLTPERSMIRYALDQGFQVFVVSWANPQQEQSDWGIRTYARAVIDAIAAVKSITRSTDLNLFSLCSGAMATSVMAAYLKAQGDESIHSMAVGVCMLEMQRDDMEMAAFANDEIIERVRARSRKAGVLKGHELALSMLWLRPAELVWGNVVNNYLLGQQAPEFDLLYWNNDWTNLPAALHSDVLDMFFKGELTEAGKMQFDGVALDLRSVDCDKLFIGGASDHITPWQACYRSAHAFGGNKQFLLSNSGHMQTMLNCPGKKNASYYLAKEMPESADSWLQQSREHTGSWWPAWSDWLQQRSGTLKKAPAKVGNRQFPAQEAAPGTYVHQASE